MKLADANHLAQQLQNPFLALGKQGKQSEDTVYRPRIEQSTVRNAYRLKGVIISISDKGLIILVLMMLKNVL